ncbi:hypothetical protein C8F01DRAFT_1310331 [Mycena amicta]|nr:hypothetical protein C8F01DRAFT_1310331 [Mycena amicta]
MFGASYGFGRPGPAPSGAMQLSALSLPMASLSCDGPGLTSTLLAVESSSVEDDSNLWSTLELSIDMDLEDRIQEEFIEKDLGSTSCSPSPLETPAMPYCPSPDDSPIWQWQTLYPSLAVCTGTCGHLSAPDAVGCSSCVAIDSTQLEPSPGPSSSSLHSAQRALSPVLLTMEAAMNPGFLYAPSLSSYTPAGSSRSSSPSSQYLYCSNTSQPPPSPSTSVSSLHQGLPRVRRGKGIITGLLPVAPEDEAENNTAIESFLWNKLVALGAISGSERPAKYDLDTLPDMVGSLPTLSLPTLRVSTLITLAIHGSPQRKLLLREIKNAIHERFPSERRLGNPKEAWQESVRHSLSLEARFVQPRGNNGQRFKDSPWSLAAAGLHATSRRRTPKTRKGNNGAKLANSDPVGLTRPPPFTPFSPTTPQLRAPVPPSAKRKRRLDDSTSSSSSSRPSKKVKTDSKPAPKKVSTESSRVIAAAPKKPATKGRRSHLKT